MEPVRIDKWLWSVRIFKSRTLAHDMVKSGKVKLNALKIKPASKVAVGDTIQVEKNGYNFTFEVIKLLSKRVSAPLAQAAYVDHTPEEELTKYESWFVGKTGIEFREKGTGRPTKRERRDLDSFKSAFYFE
jgi:ribosome-associated heat shock protein Hsp15